MTTDYSMYKARTGSKMKLTGALQTVDVSSFKKAWCDLAEKQILTVPGSCPLTKIGPTENTKEFNSSGFLSTSFQIQILFLKGNLRN